MNYKIHPLLEKRWSPKFFSSKSIEKEKLMSLFEAARWASSCFNEQPWRFISAFKNDENYETLASTLLPGNKWATLAPVLVLCIIKKNFAYNNKINRHAIHDLGLAMGNISLQACSLGIMVHQMAGFDKDSAHKKFNLLQDSEAITVVAMGYPKEEELMTEEEKKSEYKNRERKDINEIVFFNHWKNKI